MTADGPDDRAAKLREEATWYETKADALEDLREEVGSEDVEDTRLAGLYAEVATSLPQVWNTVTAFVDVERQQDLGNANGEAVSGDREETASAEAVVTEESKLARGWWAPEIVADADAMITLDVQRGLPAGAFEKQAREELMELIEEAREAAASAREEAAALEGDGGGDGA